MRKRLQKGPEVRRRFLQRGGGRMEHLQLVPGRLGFHHHRHREYTDRPIHALLVFGVVSNMARGFLTVFEIVY